MDAQLWPAAIRPGIGNVFGNGKACPCVTAVHATIRESNVNNERDIDKRTDLRGLAATTLVLLACAAAQLGFLVLFVQRSVRPAAGIPIVTSYAPPVRNSMFERSLRKRLASPAQSPQGLQ